VYFIFLNDGGADKRSGAQGNLPPLQATPLSPQTRLYVSSIQEQPRGPRPRYHECGW